MKHSNYLKKLKKEMFIFIMIKLFLIVILHATIPFFQQKTTIMTAEIMKQHIIKN